MKHIAELTEILKLVYDLNDSTIDQTGATGKLIFESTGFGSRVTLGGEVVWDDDEYRAPWNDARDAQMPIREWFNQRIVEIMEERNKMAQLMCIALRTVDAAADGGCGAAPASQ